MGLPLSAQKASPIQTKILFLLDGSGSMNADWNGQNRFKTASQILSQMVDSLKVFEEVQLGLRIYGHQFHKDLNNCQDTKLEVPFQTDNQQLIKDKLQTIQCKGVTPLAYSLEQAAKDFGTSYFTRNIIIIITDGLESCGGDPCAISKELQKRNVVLKPFVVGLGLEKDYSKEFACVGNYVNAQDPVSLKILLQKVINQAVGKTEVRVDLLDSKGKSTETNINMTFVDNLSLKPRYEYLHQMDEKNIPQKIILDPMHSYHLRVNTIPPVYQKNVFLEVGKLNVISVSCPQGRLLTEMLGTNEYSQLNVLIRKKGSNEILHHFIWGSENPKLLVGEYEVEILSTPRIVKNVEIKAESESKISISPPGIVSLVEQRQGYGSLYVIHEDGTSEWLLDLAFDAKRPRLVLQPGNYRFVFRSVHSMSVLNTITTDFSLKSGEARAIRLF